MENNSPNPALEKLIQRQKQKEAAQRKKKETQLKKEQRQQEREAKKQKQQARIAEKRALDATLVETVQQYPFLYDLSHDKHKDKILVKRTWDSIGSRLGISQPSKCFSNLKVTYKRRKQRVSSGSSPQTSNFDLEEEMRFLDAVPVQRPSSGSYSEDQQQPPETDLRKRRRTPSPEPDLHVSSTTASDDLDSTLADLPDPLEIFWAETTQPSSVGRTPSVRRPQEAVPSTSNLRTPAPIHRSIYRPQGKRPAAQVGNMLQEISGVIQLALQEDNGRFTKSEEAIIELIRGIPERKRKRILATRELYNYACEINAKYCASSDEDDE